MVLAVFDCLRWLIQKSNKQKIWYSHGFLHYFFHVCKYLKLFQISAYYYCFDYVDIKGFINKLNTGNCGLLEFSLSEEETK